MRFVTCNLIYKLTLRECIISFMKIYFIQRNWSEEIHDSSLSWAIRCCVPIGWVRFWWVKNKIQKGCQLNNLTLTMLSEMFRNIWRVVQCIVLRRNMVLFLYSVVPDETFRQLIKISHHYMGLGPNIVFSFWREDQINVYPVFENIRFISF